jgi:hypothetical protein
LAYEINVDTRIVYKRTDLPAKRKYHASVLWGNRRFLFGGGTAGVHFYENTDWTAAGQLAEDRTHVSACVLEDSIFVASKDNT